MAPRSTGRITHSLAWHVTSGVWTGWLPLLPSLTVPGCPVLCPPAKLSWRHGTGGQCQEELCPASSSRPACLPCTEMGTAPMERLV